jgi:putative ABC transport system permease protein
MTFKLLVAALRHDPRRKLLAAGVIALGALGAAALLDLVLGARDDLARSLDTYGANVRVTADGDTFAVSDLAALDRVFWRNNVVAVAPLYPLRVRLGGDTVVTLVGTWFDRRLAGRRAGLPAVRPTLPVDGRWPADGSDEVALGRRLAAKLGIARGDVVPAELGRERRELAVVGLVGGGGAEEDEALAPIAVAQGLAGHPGAAREAEVFALTVPETSLGARDPTAMTRAEYDAWYCTAYPSAIAFQIDAALPGARATVVREVASASSRLLRRLEAGLLALAALVLVAAALGVAATLTAGILERRGELALLAALGGERRQILTLYLGETAVLGIAGGAAGGALGLLAARAVRAGMLGMTASWNGVLLPVVVVAGVLVALAGVAAPLARAMRRPVATAMGGM